jgi:hypothetical protein
VLASLALASHAGALAQESLEAALESLPGEIQRIDSAGRWRTAEARGFYRVIVLRGGHERVIQRLYVQWLADGDSEHPPRVVATAGIAAVNDGGPFTFTHALHAAATNQLRITIALRHVHTGQRQQLTVVAATPGVSTVRRTR